MPEEAVSQPAIIYLKSLGVLCLFAGAYIYGSLSLESLLGYWDWRLSINWVLSSDIASKVGEFWISLDMMSIYYFLQVIEIFFAALSTGMKTQCSFNFINSILTKGFLSTSLNLYVIHLSWACLTLYLRCVWQSIELTIGSQGFPSLCRREGVLLPLFVNHWLLFSLLSFLSFFNGVID